MLNEEVHFRRFLVVTRNESSDIIKLTSLDSGVSLVLIHKEIPGDSLPSAFNRTMTIAQVIEIVAYHTDGKVESFDDIESAKTRYNQIKKIL